jgi:hypothetical protein
MFEYSLPGNTTSADRCLEMKARISDLEQIQTATRRRCTLQVLRTQLTYGHLILLPDLLCWFLVGLA